MNVGDRIDREDVHISGTQVYCVNYSFCEVTKLQFCSVEKQWQNKRQQVDQQEDNS